MKRHFLIRNFPDFLLLSIFFIFLSFYIVYEQATNCLSIDMAEQLSRHKNMLAGNADFFNPWQYRIFSTFVLESFIVAFAKVPFINYPYLPYYFLRFIQNIAIFYIAYKYYKALHLKSRYLIILGILLLGYNMSHSVFQSDLSFNTYFDVLFYLTAGYFILINRAVWIIPLMILAAFNRETSGLIPFMVIFSAVDFNTWTIKSRSNFKIGVYALLVFIGIFIALRVYYGMPKAQGIHGMTSPLDYLKFNLAFFRMYPELFGTLGIIPLIVILQYRALSPPLKRFFLLIVPLWFVIHFLKSTAVETRLFLVPQALIFVPAFLFLIEQEFMKKLQTKQPNNDFD